MSIAPHLSASLEGSAAPSPSSSGAALPTSTASTSSPFEGARFSVTPSPTAASTAPPGGAPQTARAFFPESADEARRRALPPSTSSALAEAGGADPHLQEEGCVRAVSFTGPAVPTYPAFVAKLNDRLAQAKKRLQERAAVEAANAHALALELGTQTSYTALPFGPELWRFNGGAIPEEDAPWPPAPEPPVEIIALQLPQPGFGAPDSPAAPDTHAAAAPAALPGSVLQTPRAPVDLAKRLLDAVTPPRKRNAQRASPARDRAARSLAQPELRLTAAEAKKLMAPFAEYLLWRSRLVPDYRRAFGGAKGEAVRLAARRGGVNPRKLKTAPCEAYSKGRCEFGSSCTFAHGPDELRPRLRVETYKSQVCSDVGRTAVSACKFGDGCNFSHPGESLRRPYYDADKSVEISQRSTRRPSREYYDKDYVAAVERDFVDGVAFPFGLYV